MKRIAILFALALSLGACTTAQIDQGKAIARASIDVVCSSYPVADFGFQQYVATGRVSPNTVNAERAAVAALAAICADPPSDTKTAIASAGRVLTALLTAAEQARKQASGA
jgi:hypothetical protein